MKELSLNEIIRKIKRKEQINAKLKGGSIEVKITSYLPIIGIATHGGTRIHRDFADLLKFKPNESELLEETFTDFYINRLPIQIIARDNKGIYNLQKEKRDFICEENFKTPLKEYQRKVLVAAYDSFYKILREVLDVLSKNEKRIYLYDLHSKKQDKIINIACADNEAFLNGHKLVKEFCAIDERIQEEEIGVEEDKNFFMEKIYSKYKKVSYMKITVDEVYKENQKNLYYINSINRVRRMISLGIINNHKESIKKREEILDEF